MGVMACNKSNCENIMCDTYIHGIGYICNECQEAFTKYIKRTHQSDLSEHELKLELETFMYLDKGHYNNDKKSVDEFFKQYTRG